MRSVPQPPVCCPVPSLWHRLDEEGSASETYCRRCNEVLAVVEHDADGYRAWKSPDGMIDYGSSGINAQRPSIPHTCETSPSVPCVPCIRAEYQRDRASQVRAAFREVVGLPSFVPLGITPAEWRSGQRQETPVLVS